MHKKIPNCKTPGLDGIHGFWFNKFTSIHDRLAIEMNIYVQEADIFEWMTKGKTTLIQKDQTKRTAPKQLKTKNVPIDDMENTTGTN